MAAASASLGSLAAAASTASSSHTPWTPAANDPDGTLAFHALLGQLTLTVTDGANDEDMDLDDTMGAPSVEQPWWITEAGS